MDIQFREYPDGDGYVFSQPLTATVFINPKKPWYEFIDLEDYMMRALGWEALMLSIFRNAGWTAMMALDDACGRRDDFYNVFLGIYHH